MSPDNQQQASKGKKKIVLPNVDPNLVVVGHSRTLRDLEGMGAGYVEKLRQSGIRSVQALLQRARTRTERSAIAREVGASEKNVLDWVTRADLLRVPGIGPEYASLLENAGVETVPELANRNAGALYEAIVKANESNRLVRKTPARKQVKDWVSAARSLPRAVEY
jgi:predicted flap endonuclease-1-like 5' DNA nuclease